jgi:hypothetical protein
MVAPQASDRAVSGTDEKTNHCYAYTFPRSRGDQVC